MFKVILKIIGKGLSSRRPALIVPALILWEFVSRRMGKKWTALSQVGQKGSYTHVEITIEETHFRWDRGPEDTTQVL